MRIDQPGTNNGKVSIDMPGTDVVVGRKYCVKVTYIAGPEGVQLGGCLRFRLPGFKLNEFMGALPVSCSNPGAGELFETVVRVRDRYNNIVPA